MQIAEYVDGKRRIVRHVGSAHDDASVKLLVREASRLLDDDRQGELAQPVIAPVRKPPTVPSAKNSLTDFPVCMSDARLPDARLH